MKSFFRFFIITILVVFVFLTIQNCEPTETPSLVDTWSGNEGSLTFIEISEKGDTRKETTLNITSITMKFGSDRTYTMQLTGKLTGEIEGTLSLYDVGSFMIMENQDYAMFLTPHISNLDSVINNDKIHYKGNSMNLYTNLKISKKYSYDDTKLKIDITEQSFPEKQEIQGSIVEVKPNEGIAFIGTLNLTRQ